jgi:hypothetical protein
MNVEPRLRLDASSATTVPSPPPRQPARPPDPDEIRFQDGGHRTYRPPGPSDTAAPIPVATPAPPLVRWVTVHVPVPARLPKLGLPSLTTVLLTTIILILVGFEARQLDVRWPSFGGWFTRPITEPLHLSVVFDGDAGDPVRTAAVVRGDAELRKQLEQLGCRFRAFRSDSEELASRNLKQLVDEAGGPPAILIQAEGIDRPLVYQRCPATPAEVLKMVAKIRGGR